MARGWKCASCGTENGEATISCGTCGLIRGGVVTTPNPVPPPPPMWAAHAGPTGEAPPTLGASTPVVTGRPLWRRIPLGWLVLAGIVLVGGIGSWYTNAFRSWSGEITKSGDLTASELRVGDCFDLKDETADQIDNVTARPCNEPHHYEAIFSSAMPAGDYPPEASFQAFVTDNCASAFQGYVGKAYADSVLEFMWIYPSSDGWAAGDRSIQCAVYDPRIPQLTESVKGSNQ